MCCCAPALTPRAAYAKAIRHGVPLKKGTERNTTAQNTVLHLPFPPAPFFSFPPLQIPARPSFSICFFNLFPLSVTAWSLPPSHTFHLTLTCLLVLLSAALIFTLMRRPFAYRSRKSFVNSLNSKKSPLGVYVFP